MQKILSLIITAAILYTIIQMQKDDKNQAKVNNAPTSNQELIKSTDNSTNNENVSGNFLEKTVSNVLINVLKTENGRMFFENILQPVSKPLSGDERNFKINNNGFLESIFKITTSGTGKSGPASCGHIVTVSYQILNMNNNVIKDEIKTYTLGARPDIPGLDDVIVGMMTDQTRQAVIPPKYAYYNKKFSPDTGIDGDSYYKLKVNLRELLPNHFIKENEIKIFDDEIAHKIPILCGDRVAFNNKITRLYNGEVIYDSKLTGKTDMLVGAVNLPLIFSHALYGKIPAGTRTVIAKGKTFQSLSNKYSKIFPDKQLPLEEYFMLEMSDFEVTE
ncbi:MAG: peptidylprolyl isomerase [Rickettsiaceae bacterium]|nr:MAG: peptidylprolyl isomerase [Rickettsiaceae bacterium]